MLYAKLVARIAEVSRTRLAEGKSGAVCQDSTVLLLPEGTSVEDPRAVRWLRIPEGEARGIYAVESISGREVMVDRPFMASLPDVKWELFDRGVTEEDVRKVLLHFPDVLMECEEGEQVKTYLGVIKMVRRKRKRVKDPQGRWTYSPERLQARLRPGKRLQRLLEEPPSGSPQDEPDDDLA